MACSLRRDILHCARKAQCQEHKAAGNTEPTFRKQRADWKCEPGLSSASQDFSCKGSTSSRNNANIRRPSVQTHEPVEDISHSNHNFLFFHEREYSKIWIISFSLGVFYVCLIQVRTLRVYDYLVPPYLSTFPSQTLCFRKTKYHSIDTCLFTFLSLCTCRFLYLKCLFSIHYIHLRHGVLV